MHYMSLVTSQAFVVVVICYGNNFKALVPATVADLFMSKHRTLWLVATKQVLGPVS